ncbi:hypothetical protein RHMOL_Rhmol06G0205600 [Rhododendron molle]|uniref:Uncharacterized protein n=1 Tax=Rhododendron molle TaxID=49168 RepID=A0ACC0NEA6_RHOML|nr:hypothetical protein RHMOL_Rhmol06G0205600 [Rhododendron molle]
MGTVDYTWHTPEVVPVRVLDTLPIGILRQMAGLMSKAYSGPVRVLDTLPIHNLRQMGGLPSKEVDRFSDIDNLLQKDGFRCVYQMTQDQSSSTLDAKASFPLFSSYWSLVLVCTDDFFHLVQMTQDQSSSTLDTKASPRFECVKTTPKKDEELEGIEDVDGVDENIDHETLAIDVEKLKEIAKEQIRLFLKKAHELSQEWGNIPVVLAEDFNNMPQLLEFCLKAPIYRWNCEDILLWGLKGHTREVVPVRVLNTQPIDILRQMGGLLRKPVGGFRWQWGFCVGGEKLMSFGEWGSKGSRGGGGGGEAAEVVVKEVDAERYPKAASNLGIKGYPTMLLFVNGSSQANTGGFTSQEIVIWASKKMGESVIRVNSDIRAKEFLKKHSMIVVGLFEKVELSNSQRFLQETWTQKYVFAVFGVPLQLLEVSQSSSTEWKEGTLGRGQRDDQETGAAAEPRAVPTPNANAEVEQLHKILKLCGSPSKDYQGKSKFTHSTVFKPLQPYKQCLGETFKDFPPLAVRLMETLLSIDPENQGTLASALKSEIFGIAITLAFFIFLLSRAEADDDYNSPGNKDDRDYDSDDSFEQEVVRMQVVLEMQRAPTRNQHDVSPIRERVTWSTQHLDVGTIPPQPLDAEQKIQPAPFVAPVVANRPIRGSTQGLTVQQIFDKEGKLLIPIPQCFRAPVGKYACKLATKIGVELRTNLEDLSIRRWNAADESVKAPMLQCIKLITIFALFT